MSLQEKAIFRYYNGARMVWADPLELSRRLDAALGDPDAVFRDLKKPGSAGAPTDPTTWQRALECLIANVREVFGMPRIDPETGQGATEEECNTALHAMWDFLAKKKAEHRHDAVFISVFGFPPAGFHLDYAATVGLTMNLDRLLYRDAAKALLGTSAAAGHAQLARIWFDALADVEARIDSLMWEVNSRRAEARALARRRM